mmetsp:Transcript_42842/g.104722  ORF Transcript_42842/g.104722 Transcript_42842/m.104722 type:complete len:515 (-) Transcript_42842:184-1728(-)|eukprot:CAMPEP_0206251536 /NCGR_PEP_ID=MMETSP0047_2-20121206/22080_1 /ASSEMBLY_ACC=CAM_ASM_000192 /TAXON_ID=195065 /ORGANISM="Chroomonas mesostigmatica_cf, Strain CCMP1168" /LENGTH=514 /DNA_ID=CAMNT_0053677503 /DNA_START=160 /DNA_END=1704 /DNA_ORIENTATION=+
MAPRSLGKGARRLWSFRALLPLLLLSLSAARTPQPALRAPAHGGRACVRELRLRPGALRLRGGAFDPEGPDTAVSMQEEDDEGLPLGLAEVGKDLSSLMPTDVDKDKVFQGLKNLYIKRVKPLEDQSWYSHFSTGSTMVASDFDAKPIVLLLGQYSVGKTSFIRSMLGKDFPGMRIGPEPTTDRFVAVMNDENERIVPGHALSMQKDTPFHGLAQFGNSFLNKFMGSNCDAPILGNITLIDTPGVLSGEKQRLGRDYDFCSVIEWFAERCDMIIVMFDAHKLDISDELTQVLEKLRPHQDKIRILLNKVQQIDTQQLMRVYGALMWSLGKVLNIPEVPRVYMGSFWDQDDDTQSVWMESAAHQQLLVREKEDLIKELISLPQNSIMRRISELVKRARAVKVHAFIIHYLRKQIAGWATVTVWNKTEKQAQLIQSLDREFVMAARRYNLPLGDFPNVNKMRASLREIKDLRDIPKLNKNLVAEMDKMFTADIPRLLETASTGPQAKKPKRSMFLD